MRPMLAPEKGAWRGMTLGAIPFGKGGQDVKFNAYNEYYPESPLHIYRIFPSMGDEIGPDVRDWVSRGGILWYNLGKTQIKSWQEYAQGEHDENIKYWAESVGSLAPAKVYVAIYHEPDHSVCYEECQKGGVPGNTPSNYRKMWHRVRRIFDEASVENAVWAMDYSVKIGNPYDGEPCVDVDESC